MGEVEGSRYMLFYVKARVNVAKLAEYGQALASGAITTHPLSTYCLKDDPSVGLNIWEAPDRDGLDEAFAPHAPYLDALEILHVVTANEAQHMLIEGGRSGA